LKPETKFPEKLVSGTVHWLLGRTTLFDLAAGIGRLAADGRQVDIFLIGPPGLSGQGQDSREMKLTVLIVG
jgi:hypothetical protein